MTPAEHKKRHEELHHALDELLADWFSQERDERLSSPVENLVKWSYRQTQNPTGEEKRS